MTIVHVRLARGDGATPFGSLTMTPTRRHELGTTLVTKAAYNVALSGTALTDVDMPATGSDWCWTIEEHLNQGGGVIRTVAVPASGPVEYEDLVDVDPKTLAPAAAPEAAWTVALAALQSQVNSLPDATQTFTHKTISGANNTVSALGLSSLSATGTPSSATFLRGDNAWTVPPGAAGTVTSASVVSANGFAGTVANPSTTPAITVSTTVTGLVKGNGITLAAATAGSDYVTPSGDGSALTGITKSQVGLSNVPNVDATARANHTGTQSADTLTDGTTNKAFLATERTKLTGIATGATANSSDATLEARANHTGTQAAGTITGLAAVATSGLKADVGLSAVDNTSDATKNAATATLTNKTLTAPAISLPTGIVKSDVGLSNVDNTSDASKPVSTATTTALGLKLTAASNLSDLGSAVTARTSLGLGTSATKDVGTTSTTVAAGDAPAAATANIGLLLNYGQQAGLPKRIYEPARAVSVNLWATANFYQGATLGANCTALNKNSLTPIATGTGVNQRLNTRIILPAADNVVQRYRITFTLVTTALTGGTAFISWMARDSAFAISAGSAETTITSTALAYTGSRHAFEIDLTPIAILPLYLDICINIGAASAGSAQITNVSFVQIEEIVAPIYAGWTTGPGTGAILNVYQPIGYKADGVLMRALRTFGADSVLECGLTALSVKPENSLQTPYNITSAVQTQYGPQNTLHTNNNGQVITVYKADNVTIELRGNTHGGEIGQTGTFNTDYQAYADYFDGNGWTLINDAILNHRCWRVKLVANTKMTRSDQGSPFLLVTQTYYLYADGTVRVDRTNTWQQDQKLGHFFYHMTSINPATNSQTRFYGRLGAGRQVLERLETVDKLVPPTGGTHTTATTGGTITPSLYLVGANATWSVRVTALSPFGETAMHDQSTTIVTTGNTSTITVNWTINNSPQAVAPTGFNVYMGYPGVERLVGTVGAGVTTYTITAMPTGSAALAPASNTAITGSFAVKGTVDSPVADWSAFYDTNSKAVYSLAIDRDEVLALTGLTGIRGTLQWASASLCKNYWHANGAGANGDFPYTMPNGTVQVSRLWFFTYLAGDVNKFEDEQTIRAANVKNLSSIYLAA